MKTGQDILPGMDVSLPENGFPLSLEREYDSREPDGDFGPGWSLPSSTVKPQTTRNLNAGWAEEVGGSFLTTYYLIEKYRHVVVIRFSDEEMLKFRMDVTPKSSVLYPIANHSNLSATYVPIDGTVGTLEALNVASGHLMLIENQLMEWGTDPYEPTRYKYTKPDGTAYVLNTATGIESVTDVYGNTIAYSAYGITHSSGASISITRGTGNRIETITDPLGQIIEYYYDADGMLEKVVKSGSEPVAMRMMSNYAYGQGIFEKPVLKDIKAPDGTVLGQFEYDAKGRMTALIDADGQKIIYGFDVPNHTQEITDRRGNTSVYEYNNKGYVTKKTDPDGHISTWIYDGLGNKLSETDALGNTKTFTYDASGNMLTETDALGNTTAYTYNARTVVCALGTTIKKAGSQEVFREVDYGIPIRLAEIAVKNGCEKFILISAVGADPNSPVFYNKVKGELERDLEKLGFKSLHIIRPSLLLGDREEFRLGEEIGKMMVKPFRFLIPGKYKPVHAGVIAQKIRSLLDDGTPGGHVYEGGQIT